MKKLISTYSLLLLIVFVYGQKNQIKSKPNVLFIMVDDLRDWNGYSNSFPGVKTPNLDRLSGLGMVFTNAYCAAPVCSPSRTAILSGLSPSKTGVYENGQIWEGSLRTRETLTQKFMNSGYYVAGFGKIFHGQGDNPNWDEYIYGEYSPLPETYENYYAIGNPLHIPDSLTGDWKRASNAIKVLNRKIDKPLFLACGLVRPHTPWNVPEKYFKMYDEDKIQEPEVLEDDLDDIPLIGKKIAERKHKDGYGKSFEWTHQAIVDSGLWKTNIRAYLASVTYADEQVGRLIEAWEKSNYSKNGIIVLMGDHGWHHGEKLHWSKRTLWEVGTRTPLIFVAPGLIEENTECDNPVSLLDIYPTLVDLCGLSPKNDLDGVSLKPLLFNPGAEWNQPALTIWGQNNVSVRTDQWRYIRYCDGTEELYNHNSDENEWENLLYFSEESYSKIVKELRQWVPECINPAGFSKNRTSWFEVEGLGEINKGKRQK